MNVPEWAKRKIGPLPLWQWLAIIALGLAYGYWKKKQQPPEVEEETLPGEDVETFDGAADGMYYDVGDTQGQFTNPDYSGAPTSFVPSGSLHIPVTFDYPDTTTNPDGSPGATTTGQGETEAEKRKKADKKRVGHHEGTGGRHGGGKDKQKDKKGKGGKPPPKPPKQTAGQKVAGQYAGHSQAHPFAGGTHRVAKRRRYR